MKNDEKKSITVRLDEPDLCEWAAAQSSATSSIRTAIKICILQFGKNADLLDSIITDCFANGDNKQIFKKKPDAPMQEQIQKTQKTETKPAETMFVPSEPVPAPQPVTQQPVQSQMPQFNMNEQSNNTNAGLSSLL